MVIHAPQSKVDSICENIVKHEDLFGLKNLNFDELSSDEKIRIEEAMYDMMVQFKVTPLELDNTLPKELNSLIENKWHYCLDMER